LKKVDDKVRKTENNLKYLIDKERDLMERIDKLEREEKKIMKKVDSCMTAIANSYEQVARSSMKFRHKAKQNE
jgi:predicted transcriptional regulator